MCTESEHHGIKMMMGPLTFPHVISRWFYAKGTDRQPETATLLAVYEALLTLQLKTFQLHCIKFLHLIKKSTPFNFCTPPVACNEKILLYNIWMYRNSIGYNCRSVNNYIAHILSVCVEIKWSCRNYKKKQLFVVSKVRWKNLKIASNIPHKW